MDIADAKEVLTDPEKRKMFDNGRCATRLSQLLSLTRRESCLMDEHCKEWSPIFIASASFFAPLPPSGEDPLDAEEERDRQSQRANPFRGGFNPFGGQGGFHFRFQ